MTVGTTVGGYDLVNSGSLPASQTSLDPGFLPSGKTLHARIYTEVNSNYQRFQDVAFSVAPTGKALFAHPTDGQTGVTATAPFMGAGAGAQGYYLTVGASVGGYDVVDPVTLPAFQLSYPVVSLPPGATLHARIYTEANGNYQRFQDVTFVAASGQPAS